ncbi:MAG: HD domain-containing protein [Rubrobacter sp.]|nr:HD domain-containing protein [Rubrobacter sp.]MBA3951595.1 HD domain-containing protein [Rubrobacter sp.]MDQ3361762.1 HD domain-containing protein [Actinomycetota bacterium]
MLPPEALFAALEPPVDPAAFLKAIPELSLARGLEGSPYHHLDTLDHVLEVVRRVEEELAMGRLGARVPADRVGGLRLAALLHDVAKPVTRGELEGRVLFVAHDSLGAALARRICRRLDVSAVHADLAATLTALHLKIGFMRNPRTDHPPDRLARAAGPFGEELAVLSFADRLAAQGPRLKPEHIDRHVALCADFLETSRKLNPYPEPDYGALANALPSNATDADAGYAATHARLLAARGLDPEAATNAAIARASSLLQPPTP